MPKVFKSKIGLEFVVPIIVVLGLVLFLTISDRQGWLGIIILMPVVVFVTHMFVTTCYIIDEGSLIIRCGFFFNKTINIKSIKKISETNNLQSSPATSIDRIAISYGKFDSVIISPKEKKEFIYEILKINSDVEVKLKK